MSTVRDRKKTIQARGFSLIELMVSLTIFAIVMTVSIGTLLVIIDANAKAQALYAVMTNVSFAVDSITRDTRTSHDHYCSQSPSNNVPDGQRDCTHGQFIAFTRDKDGVRVGYRYQSAGGVGWIEEKEGSGDWLRVTSEDVAITRFDVTIDGSESGDTTQPEITHLIEGYVINGLDTETDFKLQTRVSEYILNY